MLPGYDVSFEPPGEALEPGDEGEWAEPGSGSVRSGPMKPWRGSEVTS
jgi:hypothetical protein